MNLKNKKDETEKEFEILKNSVDNDLQSLLKK